MSTVAKRANFKEHMQTCKRQANVEKIFINVTKHKVQTLTMQQRNTLQVAQMTNASVHVCPA